MLENNWEAGQNGFSILITPRNQNGGCLGCGVQDVTIRRNQLINGGQGFNISGEDDEHVSQRTQRVCDSGQHDRAQHEQWRRAGSTR